MLSMRKLRNKKVITSLFGQKVFQIWELANTSSCFSKKKKEKKKSQTAPTSPHVVQMGFKKKNSWLIQKQSLAYSVEGVDCRSTMALIIMLIIIFLE